MSFDLDDSSSNDSTSTKEEKYKETFIQNTLRNMDLLYEAVKPNSVRVTRLKPESKYWTRGSRSNSQQNSESRDR